MSSDGSLSRSSSSTASSSGASISDGYFGTAFDSFDFGGGSDTSSRTHSFSSSTGFAFSGDSDSTCFGSSSTRSGFGSRCSASSYCSGSSYGSGCAIGAGSSSGLSSDASPYGESFFTLRESCLSSGDSASTSSGSFESAFGSDVDFSASSYFVPTGSLCPSISS